MNGLIRSAAILALVTLPSLAQPAPTLGGPLGPRSGRIASALHLTEAQQASIQTIREKHRPELAARWDTARQARAALQVAFRDAATPEARLRKLHHQASAARFELLLAGRAVRQEVRAVLTPEQLAKAGELRAATRHRERMRRLCLGTGLAS